MSRAEKRREKKAMEKEMKNFFKEREKEDFYFVPFIPSDLKSVFVEV
jgi:hypothetical protein